ncbi:hypothetical protein BDV10DRAFT_154740 [Aspergillus recurvatus]
MPQKCPSGVLSVQGWNTSTAGKISEGRGPGSSEKSLSYRGESHTSIDQSRLHGSENQEISSIQAHLFTNHCFFCLAWTSLTNRRTW